MRSFANKRIDIRAAKRMELSINSNAFRPQRYSNIRQCKKFTRFCYYCTVNRFSSKRALTLGAKFTEPRMKLLIVEDERALSDSIANFLASDDYISERAYTFDEAMEKVHLYEYDCILLDLMLPGGNGLDVLREIKKLSISVGVIIVSAKESVSDKVKGLKIGADDYLTKPFSLPELAMRIYALMRRRNFQNDNMLHSGNLEIDLLAKTVTSDSGRQLDLTKTEYELLLFLIENSNRVVSKSALAEHLSGDMADMMDDFGFVYTHVKNLKAKLADAGCANCIRTFYGTGYKWEK